MQGTGAPADAQAHRLSHEPTSPRSPAGSRRLRCTLGKDRRMLLVPRCASFEEVLDLAKAKFEVREKRARLLCPDPQCPDDLITLTCDADFEFMRNEHGEKLALHLELLDADDAEGGAGDSQTPAKSGGGAKMSTPGTPGTVPGEMIMGAFAEVFAQAFSRSMMSNPSPAAFQPRTPPYAPPPPPPAAPPTQPPPTAFAPPPMAPPPMAPPPLAPPPLAPPKAVSSPPPPPPPPPPPRAAAAAEEPPTVPKEKRGGSGGGPLYVQGYRPEVVKKTRHPKQVTRHPKPDLNLSQTATPNLTQTRPKPPPQTGAKGARGRLSQAPEPRSQGATRRGSRGAAARCVRAVGGRRGPAAPLHGSVRVPVAGGCIQIARVHDDCLPHQGALSLGGSEECL
jgi:hypothetical protein